MVLAAALIVPHLVLLAAPPRWLDRTIAGYALAYDRDHSVVTVTDPRTGYSLLRTVDCDGALLGLILTRDRATLEGQGYGVREFAPMALPSLRTGKGVAIGDAPSAVRARLGPPTRATAKEWTYRRRTSGHEPQTDTQTYTFAKGRLVEVAFLRDRTGD